MTKIRRHELDWLRVLAFSLLIFSHSGMPFITHNWHINNSETSEGLSVLWGFFHSWRMPLLFMVSGAGIWFAFGNRTAGQFLTERCKRLLIPLVFGILVIVPPQVYLERLAQGVNFESYISFYPHFFDGHIFAGGNFTPNHLWFIYTLFFCSLVGLPIFMFMKSSKGKIAVEKMADILSRNGGVYLLMLPLFLSLLLLKPYGKEYIFEFDQLVLVISGFIIVSHDSIMEAVERQRQLSLIIAITGISSLMYAQYSGEEYIAWAYYLLNTVGYFALLLAIFGYGRHYLNFANRFIQYTNEAVYPFYILHQTITVILAYHIVQWEINLWFKFFITTAGTAIFTLAIYHFLIRPFNLIRPLFGLKRVERQLSEQSRVSGFAKQIS